jgi:AcrR family transcriptional regulator
MARPAQADAALTKQKVLSSASALFAELGEGNTSMRAIAGGAGVSLGTVHHYFGSKAKLYDACIDAMYGELGSLWSELQNEIQNLDGVGALVEHVIRRGFSFARRNHMAIRLVMREVVDHGEVSQARREQFVDPFFTRITLAVGELLGRGSVETRLLCQSAVNLVVRYALSSERELEIVTGLQGEASMLAVESHLVEVTRNLFEIKIN